MKNIKKRKHILKKGNKNEKQKERKTIFREIRSEKENRRKEKKASE